MSKHDVCVGFCHAGTVHEPFMQSMIGLLLYDANREQRIKDVQSVCGSYIAESRNLVVKEFLKTSCTWLLFFDNDVVFNPNILELLSALTDEQHKIIGSFYLNYYVDGNLHPTWLEYNSNGDLQTVGNIENNKLINVASVGMGGTLIHRDVFETIQKRRQASDNWIWYGHDIDKKGERMGEDVTFCLRAKQYGFNTYGYTGVQLGHRKTKTVTIDDVIKKKVVAEHVQIL